MRTGSEVTTINVTGCSLCNWVWCIGKSYSTTNVFNKPLNYKRFLLDQGDNLLRENTTTVQPPLTAIPLHNNHLSATAFLFGGQSIHWLLPCLNLSTTTTFFCPQGGSALWRGSNVRSNQIFSCLIHALRSTEDNERLRARKTMGKWYLRFRVRLLR